MVGCTGWIGFRIGFYKLCVSYFDGFFVRICMIGSSNFKLLMFGC